MSVVEAKTLDRSSGYRPYAATRAFGETERERYRPSADPQARPPAAGRRGLRRAVRGVRQDWGTALEINGRLTS